MANDPVQEAEIIKEPKPRTTSPIGSGNKEKESINLITYPEALKAVIEGKKITKLEWGDKNIYGYFNEKSDRLLWRDKDGKEYVWILNGADLKAKDWIIIN